MFKIMDIANFKKERQISEYFFQHNPEVTFATFVLKSTLHKKYLFGALIGMIIQFAVFKFLYPFADFGTDSYVYILAASTHADVNFWPIGYSKFLSAFHWFTHSDTALVGFQYLLISGALLIFFFTLLYWYKPEAIVRNVLFVFLFFNPLFLYLSNNIMSDSLFLTLSLLWLTQLLWIIHCPRTWHIWIHGILLGLAFTIRYHALYYPLIALVAFLFSGYNRWAKTTGVIFPLLLIGIFILFTKEKNFEATGSRQFSSFSGWQWCSNALYIYPYIQIDSTKLPLKSIAFDRMVKTYFKKHKPIPPTFIDYSFYMWVTISPMRKYYDEYLKKTGQFGNSYYKQIVLRSEVAPVFEAYGLHLIKEHWGAYIRYYILPNTANYFLPPLEKLESYNKGEDELRDQVTKEWFNYKSMKVYTRSENLQGNLLRVYPVFFLFVNAMFLFGLIRFLWLKKYRGVNKAAVYTILLVASLFFVNMIFNISSAIVLFRYLIFPMVVFLAFGLILIEPYLKGRIEKYLEEGTSDELRGTRVV